MRTGKFSPAEHLEGLRLLIEPSKRERWMWLAQHKRERLRREMYNFPFDERWKVSGKAEAANITAYLAQHAPRIGLCYLFSESAKLDGKQLSIYDALSLVVAFQDNTLLSFVPGTLAFFEGEGHRTLLHRTV